MIFGGGQMVIWCCGRCENVKDDTGSWGPIFSTVVTWEPPGAFLCLGIPTFLPIIKWDI
jgi:hypothetical protein